MNPNSIIFESACESVLALNLVFVQRIESERQEVLRSIRKRCVNTKSRAVTVVMTDAFAKGPQKTGGELLTMDGIKQKSFYKNKGIFSDCVKADLKERMDTYDVQTETLFCIITKSVFGSHVVAFYQIEIQETVK